MNERMSLADKMPDAKSQNLVPQIRRKTEHSYSMNSPVDRILLLQRTVGNQAVQRLIKSGTLQAKLRIGQPGDVYEQEADRVAEQVMRMPEPASQLKSGCQTKGVCGGTTQIPLTVESQINSLKDGGQPLPESTRAFFEPRFGQDFSPVRVHSGAIAAQSAKEVNANAYTVGHNIVFGEGRFAPGTQEGRRLIAHELTHVVQQRAGNEERLSRSTDCSEWGGFRICGNAAFVKRIRDDLDTLNGTSQGKALLDVIASNRSPWYRSLIRIESSNACGLSGNSGNIYFNANSCGVPDKCAGSSTGWASAPNYVYLFHEIVHAYLFHVKGQGTNPERECMVTGLGKYFASMPYNENRLRCELGLPLRPCYDGLCKGFAPPSCKAAAGSGEVHSKALS